MSIHAMASWRVAFLLISSLFALNAQDTTGQPRPILFIKTVSSQMVDAPSLGYGGSTGTSNSIISGATTQWLKVEFTFAVNPPTGNFLDEAQFHVWIEGRDMNDPQGQPGQGVPVGFTGEVTYVNMIKTRPETFLHGSFYVYPDTLNRYMIHAPTDFTTKFDVHVEASLAGQVVSGRDRIDNETDPEWFRKLKILSNLVYNKNQTPFLVSDPTGFPAIKLRASQE